MRIVYGDLFNTDLLPGEFWHVSSNLTFIVLRIQSDPKFDVCLWSRARDKIAPD